MHNSINQQQKAGNNSNQQQATTINNYYNNVEEEKIRKICEEIAKKYNEGTVEAVKKALDRIGTFSMILLNRINKDENTFSEFTEPDFQYALKIAQTTASCTNKERDYNLLSELLKHRVIRNNDTKKKASIKKALSIVNQIDDDSLCALTLFHCVTYFRPLSGNVNEGLNNLNNLYGKLNLDLLPKNDLWIDNLEILGAIRVNAVAKLKLATEYFSSVLSGYNTTGILKDSTEYQNCVDILKQNNLDVNIFTENVFLKNYYRLNLPIINRGSYNEYFNNSLTSEQNNAINSIIKLYTTDKILKRDSKEKFCNLLKSYSSISKVISWWDTIKISISLTSIGKTIAHAYIKTIDESLPDLD